MFPMASSGTISGFSVGTNGVLTELAGSPFLSEPVLPLRDSPLIPRDNSLRCDSANNKVVSFSMRAERWARDHHFWQAQNRVAITVDSTSSFLYSANQGSNDVSAFKITSGALTQLAGSPYAVETDWLRGRSAAVHSDCGCVEYISIRCQFRLFQRLGLCIKSSDGTLGLITNSPFVEGFAPQWIVTTQ